MDATRFWTLIDHIDIDALRDGDDDDAVTPLVHMLSDESEAEIRSFEDLLAEHLYNIDGEAYAAAAAESGQSADGFLYARCYVIARGRKHYDMVKAHPDKMSKSVDDWCEALLYASQRAWALSTGSDERDWDHEPPFNYETGSNLSLWP